MNSLQQTQDQQKDHEQKSTVCKSLGDTSFSANFPSNTKISRRPSTNKHSRVLKPFSTEDIKVLVLENINQTAIDIFNNQGYQVEFCKSSLPENELVEKIKDFHAVCIRSKTRLTAQVLSHAKNLVSVGCFCIGTNQVDLEYAARQGIAVFNSPFSNSRSVAELVIAEIVSLARQLGDRSIEMHKGTWNKVSNKCWEIRGKTLGIVGYGHIGSQLSVLAEAFGMRVLYYDILTIMGLGTAKQVSTLDELLGESDFVSFHVPATEDTHKMMSAPQIALMKNGAYLINASRGSVVDIPYLIQAIKEGKLAGAALDVFPNEPQQNGSLAFSSQLNSWASDLMSLPNVILTPHIGGSTEEAQSAIGIEVASALSRYINEGSSIGSVNFPEVSLRPLDLDKDCTVRVLYIHKNVPGVLKTVNNILSTHNIDKQFSDSSGDVAYLMADISNVDLNDIKNIYDELNQTKYKISIRLLY